MESCTSSDGTCGLTSNIDLASYAAAVISAMGLATILLLQMDSISRRILSHSRLLAKRRQEYEYAVSQSCEYNTLMIRQFVGGGKGNYDPKLEVSSWEIFTSKHVDEMQTIITDISDVTKPSPVIVAVEQDLLDEVDPNTYYLFLAFPPSPSNKTKGGQLYPRRVRVPLVFFCELLATAFDGQITSTALCFIADASSGLGSEMLTTVIKRCNHGVVSTLHPAFVLCVSVCVLMHISLLNEIHPTGYNIQSCLDDILVSTNRQENT